MVKLLEKKPVQIDPDLTLREVAARLDKSNRKLYVHFEHGVYHAYVVDHATVSSYDRGDLAQAVGGATADLA